MRVHYMRRVVAAAIGAAAVSGPCIATDNSGQNNSSPSGSLIPSSGDAVKAGDIIFFRSDAAIFNRTDKDGKSVGPFCGPPNSRFLVTSISPGTKTSVAGAGGVAGSNSTATPSNTQIVTGVFPSGRGGLHHPQNDEQLRTQAKTAAAGSAPSQGSSPAGKSDGAKASASTQKNATAGESEGADKSTCADTLIATDIAYNFTTDQLDGVYTQRMGITYGALLIPYKFYFTDKSFKSNPSTVGFVGYEGYIPGLSLAGVLALGPGLATTNTSSGNDSSSSGGNQANQSSGGSGTFVTYTAALGAIATFGGSVKAGLLLGRDWQGSGSGFKYENKTWMALSIGTSF
jgi:hypothetical protein